MTITGIDYNNYTTVIEAPPWWQTWGVGMAGGAVAGLVILLGVRAWINRGIDHAYDDGECDEGCNCFACASEANLPTLDADQPRESAPFARLRERFRSHDIEDATDDPEVFVGGWLPLPRNQVLGDDGELHPIDEAAQLQGQENADV